MKNAPFALLLLLSAACRQEHPVSRGIYYWKTAFQPTAYERSRLQAAACTDLYLRCFDVVRGQDGLPAAAGIVRGINDTFAGLRTVPVVYITQEALNAARGAAIAKLASQMDRLLSGLWQHRAQPAEVQLDCDWTQTSRDRYFALLRALRQQPFFTGKRLSCTIRLHQIKYQGRAGVPPVDRGVLMCYNMGSLKKPGSHNSILNPALAEDYLRHLGSYPLPLDVALPLFDWCLLFREGRLRGILRDVSEERIASSGLFRKSSATRYTCLADGMLDGYELRAGDEVRAERSGHEDILRIARYAAEHIRRDSLRVLLFHCDSLTLAKHPQDELEAIYSAFD